MSNQTTPDSNASPHKTWVRGRVSVRVSVSVSVSVSASVRVSVSVSVRVSVRVVPMRSGPLRWRSIHH